MPSSINPYVHTSFVQNPMLGRKLYADEVHSDMMGVPNLFTTTPTINKYAHSVESAADIAKLPAIARSSCSYHTENKTISPILKSANETTDKRKLTSDSIYEREKATCPLVMHTGKEENIGGRRRTFSEESRYDLMKIPDPFQPKEQKSDYVIDQRHNSVPVSVQSHYACDQPMFYTTIPPYPLMPNEWRGLDQRAVNKYPYSMQSQHDLQRAPPFQTHSSYDYTAYAMVPPPPSIYMPLPLIGPQHYCNCPAVYAHQPYYHNTCSHQLGPVCCLCYSTASHQCPYTLEFNGGHRHHCSQPIIPNNETVNKYARGVESITDLNKLEVDFEPKPIPVAPSTVGSNFYRMRDFSVDSLKDLNALPSFSQISLYNTPTKGVSTAKSIASSNVGNLSIPAHIA